MAGDVTGRRRSTKPKKQARAQKRKRDDVDVEKLEQAVTKLDTKEFHTHFSSLPLSHPTKAGLSASHFTTLTDIQSRAIPLALQGHDILGAARTGSGKTLAFLVPVLENLYRTNCIGADAGLGAMIISPTRELAIQIFDVLFKIGKQGHMFAAGLIIGGKSLAEEQAALARMNIVVCTPGRMLQHLSETPIFSLDGLRMLVLDEADRILDMGFQNEVDSIIEYLPKERQTLLFSATQTKRVSDLARLSLRNPEYVSVHEAAATATPATLQQNYTLTPLSTKLDTLWSFLQSAKKSKILVFLSSGKQVRFIYEAFKRMQPGIPLLHLHGRQKQTARLDITTRFSSARHSCLFSTDVAARGLDFPAVDWVVQVDAPEDADTYIHRVGRTARYEREGRAVLFLDPSEEAGMLARLAAKKVPIERINVRQRKQQSIRDQVLGLCVEEPQVKYLGQKAFASYVRSLHLQHDKSIFNVTSYDLEGFASSLGLPGAPRIKFLQMADPNAVKQAKNAPRRAPSPDLSNADEDSAKEDATKAKKPRTKYDRMFERKNQDIFADHYKAMIDGEPESEDATATAFAPDVASDDEVYTIRRHASNSPPPSPSTQPQKLVIDTARRARALKSRKGTARLLGLAPTRIVFDEKTGVMVPEAPAFDDEDALRAKGDAARQAFVDAERADLAKRDVGDREVAKAKRREKRLQKKRREKEEGAADIEEDSGDEPVGLPMMQQPFADLADLYDDENGDDADEGDPGRIEDLEKMAAGILD